jgi:hypothetical protein
VTVLAIPGSPERETVTMDELPSFTEVAPLSKIFVSSSMVVTLYTCIGALGDVKITVRYSAVSFVSFNAVIVTG